MQTIRYEFLMWQCNEKHEKKKKKLGPSFKSGARLDTQGCHLWYKQHEKKILVPHMLWTRDLLIMKPTC